MQENSTYFTFPISIFKDAFNDISVAANNTMFFAGYSITTGLEYDEEEEKMKYAARKLNMTYGNPTAAYKSGEKLYRQHNGSPMTSISTTIIFDYYKNEKTEFQIASLMAFAAVRSILQKKAYCKTNKGHIHARMFGYASIKDMPKKLSEMETKYKKRWHIDKVLRELELNWGLKTFSNHTRGLYIGFDKVSYEQLATINEEKKIKNKVEALKQIKNEALSHAKSNALQNSINHYKTVK